MALTLDQVRKRLSHVRAKSGNKDLDDVLRAIVEGDLELDATLIDLRARSFFWDDFLAAGIDARLSSTAGAGTGNAALTTVAGAENGQVTIKSASDDGTHAQNFSAATFDQLNWKANKGGLVWEMRAKISDVSEAYLFFGFTDTISTTVEGPIFMNAGVIDSDAADACGLVYDIDATTDVFYLGGVKNNTDTDPLSSGFAPADDTWFTLRVEVDVNGVVYGYINGALVGSVKDAVTATVALTPAIVIGNRSANQVTLTVDYIAAAQNR
jgi:hypothetical protein